MPHLHLTPHGVIAMTCLVLLALTAQAAETTRSRPPENRPAKAAAVRPVPNTVEPKLICKQVQQTGSHFRRKVCATAEAWEAPERRAGRPPPRVTLRSQPCKAPFRLDYR